MRQKPPSTLTSGSTSASGSGMVAPAAAATLSPIQLHRLSSSWPGNAAAKAIAASMTLAGVGAPAVKRDAWTDCATALGVVHTL